MPSDLQQEAARKAQGAEAAVWMEGVEKYYDAFHALKHIDLEVKSGERIVICGPSGSGKSTLIRCINCLEEIQSGRILVYGRDLTSGSSAVEAIRREVGMVFQQFNLFPHISVLQNITIGPIWVRKMKKSDAEDLAMSLLERVGIPEQAGKYPGQLSGGQQQRVAMAIGPAASLAIAIHRLHQTVDQLSRFEISGKVYCGHL